MPSWATPDSVRQATRVWTSEQITCRTYGHNWTPRTVFHRPGAYTITQVCGRCGNERYHDMDERGYVLSRWRMNYRDGYLLKGMGRIGADGRSQLRLASLQGLHIEEITEGA